MRISAPTRRRVLRRPPPTWPVSPERIRAIRDRLDRMTMTSAAAALDISTPTLRAVLRRTPVGLQTHHKIEAALEAWAVPA